MFEWLILSQLRSVVLGPQKPMTTKLLLDKKMDDAGNFE